MLNKHIKIQNIKRIWKNLSMKNWSISFIKEKNIKNFQHMNNYNVKNESESEDTSETEEEGKEGVLENDDLDGGEQDEE